MSGTAPVEEVIEELERQAQQWGELALLDDISPSMRARRWGRRSRLLKQAQKLRKSLKRADQ